MCPPDDVSTPATDPANTAAAATETTAAPETPAATDATAATEAPVATAAPATTDVPVATELPHYSIIETWVADLIGNIAHLRETEPFNILRAAIEDLKSRL